MANNTTLNAGTGGDTIRDLDRAGVKTPIVAIDLNPAGAETLMAGTMPVSGTVTANAGTGTMAVSAASLPLPAGAATAAKQPALGAAGTAAADVLTVQGIAAMTALKVDGSAVTQPVSGTVTANAGTNMSTAALALETGGHLAAIDGKVPALGQALAAASVPVVLTAAQLTTLTPVSTVTANQGGTWNVGTVTTLTGITNNVTVVGTGTFATQAAQSGTWNVGTVTAVTTVAAVTTITNALPAGTNTIGAITPAAATSGGATPARLISAATTNATSVKASAGVVYAISAFNTNAAARYLKLYDKASAPTVGTDTPVATYLIPPSSGGFTLPFPVGVQFTLGIALAVTGAMADADATAIGAGDVCLNVIYK